MEFLNFSANESAADVSEKHLAYQRFLETTRDSWPRSAFEFATSTWHYDPEDHRCPHDSWLKHACVSELRDSAARYVSTGLVFEIVLLGAYHDGELELKYTDVTSYSLQMPPEREPVIGHGDWLMDELRLSPNKSVIHEIKFHSGANWLIECADVETNWRAL